MAEIVFFETALQFRAWLQKHAASATELTVGYHKVATGHSRLTWSESVDEALCYGWIDGVRRRIDEHTYSIRFTPRKPTTIWSAVNIAKVEKLHEQGRVTPAGELAFAKRTSARSIVYAHEQTHMPELSTTEWACLQADKRGWAYFETSPRGYRKFVLHWIASAKRASTRASRLSQLREACTACRRLP